MKTNESKIESAKNSVRIAERTLRNLRSSQAEKSKVELAWSNLELAVRRLARECCDSQDENISGSGHRMLEAINDGAGLSGYETFLTQIGA